MEINKICENGRHLVLSSEHYEKVTNRPSTFKSIDLILTQFGFRYRVVNIFCYIFSLNKMTVSFWFVVTDVATQVNNQSFTIFYLY